jgi:hypothetical protein
LDARSRRQTEVWVTYGGYIVAWFCFLFMIQWMNPPQRNVSAFMVVAFAVAAVCAIAAGFVLRKKLFAQSTEVLRADPHKALRVWRAAHFIGFTCAMNVTIFGVALKFIGTGWLVPGIFFAVSLGFLVLWRPRSNLRPS